MVLEAIFWSLLQLRILLQKWLEQLPDKILLHIFSFLPLKQLGNLALVCRKWRLLAYDSRLWQRVSLRPEHAGLHVNSVDALMQLIGIRFGASLRYLELPSDLITG